MTISKLGRDHHARDAQNKSGPANNFNGDHGDREAQPSAVVVEESEGGVSHSSHDAQRGVADPADALLLLLADSLNDIERARIATANRLRSVIDVKGWGDTEAAMRLVMVVNDLERTEQDITKTLERAMRGHPLGPWVERTKGVGLKQAARLLTAIGDPLWNDAEDRPRRGPAELWAYCGYRPDQKRTKGVKSNWNAAAKMRARMVAESAVQAGVRKLDGCDDENGYDLEHRVGITSYGEKYLAARRAWAAKDKTDLHRHNHALRVVAKAVLRDLFLQARALDHPVPEAQVSRVER